MRTRRYPRRRHYPEERSEYKRRSRDYRNDSLSDEELMNWSKDLLDMVDPKDKYYFSKDNIERRMNDLGIDCDFADVYTSALMMYTDYHNTLGNSNMDLYLRMAKDFLCDDDAEIQGGDKLAAYYDTIVEGY